VSVQRIDNKRKRMHGWQARAYLCALERQRPIRLTRFFADRRNGGAAKALHLAEAAEMGLKIKARRLRGEAMR